MRSLRLALMAVFVLTTLVLSLAVMHAAMVSTPDPRSHGHVAPMSMAPAQAAGSVDIAVGPEVPMGGISPMDCLLYGMVCFLMAVALLLLAIVFFQRQSFLRARALQLVAKVRGRARIPSPPSLLVLSISRV